MRGRAEQQKIIMKMLERLLDDLRNVQQKGTGYYTCEPFVGRYNKILMAAKEHFSEETSLLASFEPLEGTESVDPLDKTKVMQRVLVEGGQLDVVMETCAAKPDAQ